MDQLLNAYGSSAPTGVAPPKAATSPFDSTGMSPIWTNGGGGNGMGEGGDSSPGYQSGWQGVNPDGSKTNYDMTGYNQGSFSGDGMGGGVFGSVMKVLPAATLASLAAIGGAGAYGAMGGEGAALGTGVTTSGVTGGTGAVGTDLGTMSAAFNPALDSQAAYLGGTQVVPGAAEAAAGGVGPDLASQFPAANGGPGMTPVNAQGVAQGVSMPATSSGTPGFMDSLSQMYNNPSMANLSTLGSSGLEALKGGSGSLSGIQGLSSLYDMYAKNKLGNAQMDLYNQNRNAINNYYAPGSPEAKLMEQTMNRQDAAAGRNSQYGVRATDLQAKIAQAKMQALSSMAGGQSSLLTSGMGNNLGMFNSLAGYLGQNQSTASMPGFGGSTQNNGQIPSWLQALMNNGGKG